MDRLLSVRVSADIASFQQAMSQAQASLHSFHQALGASGQAAHGFQQAAGAAGSAASQLGSGTQSAAHSVQTIGQAAHTASAGQAQLTSATLAGATAAGTYRDSQGRLRDSMGRYVTDANAAAQATNSVTQSAAQSVGSFVKRAVAIVGVGAAFKSTVKAGMDFQSSLNTLGAVSGATAGKMTQVADTARKLGNDISIPGASAADAAAAMTELAKGGLSVDQAMQAAKGTLQLAAAAQIDGAQAAEIQAKAINTFGLAGKDASHVGDVLANTANAATGDITDFAAALAQGGLVAHSMGISIDDTSTALGLFANQGLIGSDAGTSLKSMLVALQSPTKQQTAALEALGVKAYDAQGNFVGMRTVTEQLSAAQKTMTQEQFNAAAGTAFGTDAVRAAIAVASGGPAAYDKMSAAVGKVGGAATLAGAQTKGLKGAFGQVQNAAQDAQIALMDKLSPALEAGTKQLAGMIPSITDALVPALGTAGTAVIGVAQQALPLLSSAATAIAPLFTAAASGIGAIMPILGGVVGMIGGVAKIFAGLPGPVHAAVLAMLAMRLVRGPIGSVGDTAGKVGTQIKLMGQQFATLRLAGMGPAVSAAAVGLRGMGTAAKGLGRAMSGAFGGPIGLAIVAITTALSIFSNRNKEARQRIEDHRAAITALAETMDKASGKISQATKDAVTQDFANVAPAFDAIGLKAGDAAQAIIKMQEDGGVAAQKFREQVVNKINFDDVTKRLSNSGVDFVSQFSGLLNMSAQDIMRIVATGGKGAEDLQAKLVALGAAPQFVTDGFNRLRGDTENVVSTFSAFVGQQDKMAAGSRVAADAVKTLREQLASAAGVDFTKLNGAMDSAVAGGKDLESTFAAFGFSGPQVAAILKQMGDSAVKGGGNLHYMTQAAADAAGAAADAAPKVEALSGAAKKTDDAAKKAAASADVWKKAVDEAKAPTSGLKAALDETKAAADGVTTAADFMSAAILRASGHDVDAATAQREQAAAMRGVTQGIYDKVRAGEDEKKSTADRIQAEKDLAVARNAGRAGDETAAAFAERIAGLSEKVASAKRSEQDAHLKNAAAQTADVQGYEKAAATAAQAVSQVTNVALATGDYTKAVAAGQAEMAKQRQAFIDSAIAAGVSKDAAAKLADQYGLMPKSVVTAFTAETAAAQRNGDLLIRTYDATNKTWTATFTSAGDARTRAAAGETLQAYDQVKGTWTANIDAKNQGALEGIAATTKAFADMPDKTVNIGADTTNLYADLTAANKAKLDEKLSKFLADTNPYFTGLSAANKAELLAKIGPLLGDTAPFFGKLNEANRAKLLSKVAPLLVNVSPYFAGLVSANRAKLLSKVAPLTSDNSPYFRGLSAANRAELKAKLAKLTGDAAPYFTALSEANRAKFLDKLSKIMGDNTDAKTKIKATQDAIDALTGKTIPITYTGAVGPYRAGGGASKAVQKAARGRLLRGPGTGTSDSIPVDASDGEFIVNARATKKHLPLIEAINNDVPAFAAGGLVSNVNMLGSSVNAPNFANMFDAAAGKMMPAMAAKWQAMAAAAALQGGGFSAGSGNWGPPNLHGLAANTLAAEKFVQSHFGINNIGGWAPSGSVAASDHPKGKAIDVMIANWQTAAGIAKGNEVASYFQKNPDAYGTKYEIWRNRIDTGSGWRPYIRSDRGNNSDPTLAHMDHVHISFLSGPAGPLGGGSAAGGGASVSAGGAESRWYPLMHRVIAAKGFNQNVFPIMAKQMHMESSGNPRAINLTDSNARAGHPSVGLLQFIPSTFRQYADPGFNTNIYDPESQFRAFLNYVPARYPGRGFNHLTDIGNRAYVRGGKLDGPGTGISDSLNIRASKGEFLTNAKATAKHLPLLKAINADVPAYAAGGLVSSSALAGLSPRQPGTREGLVIDGLTGLTTAIRELRDAATAASEQYHAAAGALGDAQGEAIRTAAAGRADVAAARKDLQITQVDQGRNVEKAKLDAARSVADAAIKRAETLRQARADIVTATDKHKAYQDYAAADRATLLDLRRAQEDARLSTQDAVLQQRRETEAAAGKLRAVQAAATADNQSATAKVAAASRVRQAELQLAKATDARAARAEALQRAESRLSGTQTRLGQRFDLLTDQLGNARDKLSGLRDERSSKAAGLAGNIGNYDSGILGQPETRRTPADIIRGMTFDLSKVSRFTNNLNELKKKGLSGGLLDQIASAGVDGGGSTAGTLRNASVADIARINALQKKTEQWASVGGSLVAGATFDPLIASQGALVNRLSTYTAQVDAAMRAIANALTAMDVKLVIDPQGIARLVNRGNVLLGRRT